MPVPGRSLNDPSCRVVASCTQVIGAPQNSGKATFPDRARGGQSSWFVTSGICAELPGAPAGAARPQQPAATQQRTPAGTGGPTICPPGQMPIANGSGTFGLGSGEGYGCVDISSDIARPDRPSVSGTAPGGDGPAVSTEEAAAATAAIATILIAAGLAANVAQAIAAALANALQSGVQLSAEEMQRAIADALREMVGRKAETDDDASSGDEAELPKSNAAADDEENDAETIAPEPEPAPPVDPAEERRRRQLETGVHNALAGMPPGAHRDELAAQLEDAARNKNRWALEDLWDQVREQRQAQIRGTENDAWWDNAWATLHGGGETAATFVRDTAKVAGALGLGVATGGGASAVQGVAAAAIGSGTLIGTGAIEGGLQANNGEVGFDGWEATRGAARGALDAAGALVGGVGTNRNPLVAAAKTVFAATSTYGRTFADTHNVTGDRDLAHSRATLAAGADALKTLGGEALDELSSRTSQRGEAQKIDGTMGDPDLDGKWVAQTVEERTQASLTRIAAAKSAGNIVGKTLGNIASSDKDLTTAEAGWQAVKSEAHELATGKIVSAADTGDKLTERQRAVIARLEAERAGTARAPGITPDYDSHLSSKGVDRDDYVPASDSLDNNGNFTSEAQRHVQAVADSHGVKLVARTVDLEGSEAITKGEALPKPPDMKANTGKDIDVLLGMDPAHKNRVVVFPSELPDRAAVRNLDKTPLSDAQWKGLQERHQMRRDQYDEYSAKLAKGGKFSLDGQLVRDTRTGLPIAGDMDVLAVTGLHDEPLPSAVTNQVMNDLIRAEGEPGKTTGSTVMHSEHLGWDIASLDDSKIGHDGKTDRERAIEINGRILDRVKPGGEAMAVFSGRPGMSPPRAAGTFYQGSGPKTE
ncbi:MAG: hypothetical protein KDJ90_20710 [Nitratireductor sp.]|nr:hypothetical protein [Nitratireductor sp.]